MKINLQEILTNKFVLTGKKEKLYVFSKGDERIVYNLREDNIVERYYELDGN